MPTILLFAHPTFDRSRANRALLSAVGGSADLEIADLYALYPDGRIDAAVERERLLRATRLVLQFPMQWYSVPALLKEWMDAVLTPLFYLAPDIAAATAGLPLLAATTTGGPLASYLPGGTAMTIADLFAPLQATARKCDWRWQTPFALYDVRHLDDAALAEAGEAYRATILATPVLVREEPFGEGISSARPARKKEKL